MTLDVKICGLSDPQALDAALDAGANFVGFVFFPASPRHVSLDDAHRLGGRVRDRAGKVALTVDADDATLDAIVDALAPDLLQLHGRETSQRIEALKARYRLPIWKVIPVGTREDLGEVRNYAGVADRLMFDARAPKDATRPGGLGRPFDWRLLMNLDTDSSFMLSGGINAGNVAEALRMTRAGGVDVSSGVERAPGQKDAALIESFIRAARKAAQQRETVASPA